MVLSDTLLATEMIQRNLLTTTNNDPAEVPAITLLVGICADSRVAHSPCPGHTH